MQRAFSERLLDWAGRRGGMGIGVVGVEGPALLIKVSLLVIALVTQEGKPPVILVVKCSLYSN